MTTKKSFAAWLKKGLFVGLTIAASSRIAHSQINTDHQGIDWNAKRAKAQAEYIQSTQRFWRTQLGFRGIKDQAVQDAVVNFLTQQQQRAQPVEQQLSQLSQTVQSTDSTDTQIGELTTRVRSSLQNFKEQRVLALTDLDTRTGYSHNARLATGLTYLGIVGDEEGILNSLDRSLRRLGTKSSLEAMQKLNVTDPDAVGMLSALVRQQQKTLAPLTGWANESESYLQHKEVTDEESSQYLNIFRQKVADFARRHEDALVKVDARIGYSHKPRLAAALLLMGITDHSVTLLDDIDLDGHLQFKKFRDLLTGQDLPKQQRP